MKKITASDSAANDYFGSSYSASSISISGNTVVVGVVEDDGNAIDSGSAYVFESKEEAMSKAMRWIPLLLLDD